MSDEEVVAYLAENGLEHLAKPERIERILDALQFQTGRSSDEPIARDEGDLPRQPLKSTKHRKP